MLRINPQPHRTYNGSTSQQLLVLIFSRLHGPPKMALTLSTTISWSLHLALLFRRRAFPQLGHLTLPPEIVLMIAEHLNKTSLMCLALTCRTFFHLCFPRSPELTPPEKEEFLLLLEKDAPHLYFCHYCVELHRWRKWWFRSFNNFPEPDLHLGTFCKQRQTPWFRESQYSLPYHLARVVMNRHFYGAAHGVPVRKLEMRTVDYYSTSEERLQDTWHARIINDQLMLSSVYTIFNRQGDAKALREFIDSSGPGLCRHLCTKSWAGYDVRRIPELTMGSSPPDYFASCTGSIKSCTVCMTDYCIDIDWHGRAKGWIIKIVTYRQLGTVRSPFDWNWYVMVEFGPLDVLRSSRYRPGIVRHIWSTADEVVLEPEGEWVGEPQLPPWSVSVRQQSLHPRYR